MELLARLQAALSDRYAVEREIGLPVRAAVCRIPCLILCLAYVEQTRMARRPVLTRRQRSALFSLPPREADRRRHDTLSDNDLQHIGDQRRPRNKLGFALQPS